MNKNTVVGIIIGLLAGQVICEKRMAPYREYVAAATTWKNTVNAMINTEESEKEES